MAYNAELVQKARRNKVHANGTPFGRRVCAEDRTEPHSTKRPCEKAKNCSRRHLSSSGEDEYYERAVTLSYIGEQPRLLVVLRRVRPGESEVGAAIRMLADVYRWNFRY